VAAASFMAKLAREGLGERIGDGRGARAASGGCAHDWRL